MSESCSDVVQPGPRGAAKPAPRHGEVLYWAGGVLGNVVHGWQSMHHSVVMYSAMCEGKRKRKRACVLGCQPVHCTEYRAAMC